MVLTVGLLIAGVLVFFAMILIFIAILCGSICVVHQLRKMDAGRFVRRCASSKVSYIMCSDSIHTFLIMLVLPSVLTFLWQGLHTTVATSTCSTLASIL